MVVQGVLSRTNMVSKSVFKIEVSLCFLSFFTFLLSVPGPVYRRDVMQSKKKKSYFLLYSPENFTQEGSDLSIEAPKMKRNMSVFNNTTALLYCVNFFGLFYLWRLACLCGACSSKSYNILFIGEMRFPSCRWKLHFDWIWFLMQSPINIMSSCLFSKWLQMWFLNRQENRTS